MQRKALWFCLGVVGIPFCSAVDAQQLNVAVGLGYETQSRAEASLARSFVQVAPSYQWGRLRLTAPVQVSFRGTGESPRASSPLAFKSDDWVDLGATSVYQVGRTALEWEHHSRQLLSSGVLPSAGFGDVERDDRFLARVSLTGGARVGAALRGRPRPPATRLLPGVRALGGYWRMDRWTDTAHGGLGGPAVGLEGLLPLGRRLTAHGQLLAGRQFRESRNFGEAFLTLRYQQAAWFAAAQWKVRRVGGNDRLSFFSSRERDLSLSIGKELR